MGIITLALFTGTKSGAFKDLHPMFNFLHTPGFIVAKGVIVLCAATMAAGTAAGGWRIIRTLGHGQRNGTAQGCWLHREAV